MKLEVNISKKYLFSLFAILIIISGLFAVYALWDTTKTFWHDANDVKITINGLNYSLQEAITTGKLGSAMNVTFHAGILASGPGGQAHAKDIGKHEFCAMSLSSEADDAANEWKNGACNIVRNSDGNWTINTVATNGYYNCYAVCFDAISTSGSLSQKDCRWQQASPTANPNDTIECNSDEFMAGIRFESPWIIAVDNHSSPEVYQIKCCKII